MMSAIHLFAPHITDCRIGRGGTSAFRSVAAAAGRLGHVVCYQAPPATSTVPPAAASAYPGVVTGNPQVMLDHLLHSGQPGDLVVKCSGAGHESDHELDTALVNFCQNRGLRMVYLDADAPSRLPLMPRPFYLDDLLPDIDAVALLAGGPVAVAEYERRGARKVCHIDPAIMAFALVSHQDRTPVNERACFDLAITIGSASRREERIRDWLHLLGPRPAVAVAGDWPFGESVVPNQTLLPAMDPVLLQDLYARSRFTLNLIRRDVRGYSRVPPARVFEAALAGSCVLTQRYAGLEQDLVPGHDCLEVTGPEDIAAALALPERRRQAIADAGRRRVRDQAVSAAQHFASLLTDAMSESTDTDRRRSPPDRRHNRTDKVCRPGPIVAVLPDVSSEDRQLVRRTVRPAGWIELTCPQDVPVRADVVVVSAAGKHDLDAATRHRSPRAVVVTGVDPRSRPRLRWLAGRDWRLEAMPTSMP